MEQTRNMGFARIAIIVAVVVLFGCSNDTMQIHDLRIGNVSDTEIYSVKVIAGDKEYSFGFLGPQSDNYKVNSGITALSGNTLQVEWQENAAERNADVPISPDIRLNSKAKSIYLWYIGNGKWKLNI